MKIKQGGTIENLRDKISSIQISRQISDNRTFELWINEDSLSYLTLDELLDLREEINIALKSMLNQ